jgi:hypothetical protein
MDSMRPRRHALKLLGVGLAAVGLTDTAANTGWSKEGHDLVTPPFSLGTPSVINTTDGLSVALPLNNRGTEALTNLWATDIALDNTTRLIPAELPRFLGTLGVDNTVSVNARFNSEGLAVGGEYVITVDGTYHFEDQETTYYFSVQHRLVVPPVVKPPIKLLNARVTATITPGREYTDPNRPVAMPGVWLYELFNDEAPDSSQWINTFSLDIVAPINVSGTPEGWEVQTNKASYILWYATDQRYRVAPGKSLRGFKVQSASKTSEATGFAVTAWDQQTDQAGLVALGTALSPSRIG